MRKLTYCVVILAATLLPALQADSQNIHQVSVAEAADLAFKNVQSLKNSRLDYENQKALNSQITGQAYPQISGNVSVNRYFAIPVTAIPDFISPGVYSILEENDVENSTTGAPIKSPNNFGIFPAQFGVPWTASAGFSIQQLLFQPDVFVGLKARDASLEYAANNIKVMEDSVKSNVYNAYYAVLIAQKQISFLDSAVVRLGKLMRDQQIMYENGFVEELDVSRTQVNLTNVRTNLNRVQNLARVGMAALKLTMGIPQTDSLLLRDTLTMDGITSGLLDNSGFRYEDRNEIKTLNLVKRLLELDVRRNRLAYVPTISAFWNYSQNAQRLKFDFFDTNERWFPTSILGVNVAIPIFNGFQTKYRIQQARITLEKMTNTIDNLKQVIDFQQEAARVQLSNAIASLQLQEDNMELAQRVYSTSKIKFEQGIGSNFEILQAETDLETAQSNYFQALYDAAVGRTAYLRALGRL